MTKALPFLEAAWAAAARPSARAEGLTPVMYDMNAYHGGHTASFAHPGGFVFDIGPHISYTKDPRIQAAVRRERR